MAIDRTCVASMINYESSPALPSPQVGRDKGMYLFASALIRVNLFFNLWLNLWLKKEVLLR